MTRKICDVSECVMKLHDEWIQARVHAWEAHVLRFLSSLSFD